MKGAILGDIWGSIFEEIPSYSRRLEMIPTDDTFLTCACYDFLFLLSNEEIQYPQKHFVSIYNKAVISLKKWYLFFPENGAFSKGFTQWCKNPNQESKSADTNGCLMRQSPIAWFAQQHKLSIEQTIEISRIFCYPTHNSTIAFENSKDHISIIYQALHGLIKKDHILINYPNYIKPLSHWIDLAKNTKYNFIWNSSDSLAIALSAIHYSNNWQDMMRFFISIGGDIDTYASIAGPLAQIFFGLPSNEQTLLQTIKSQNTSRFDKILKIYNLLQ